MRRYKEVAADNDLRAERVDDPQTNDRISLRIVESLEAAEFVVADLTHSKPNVYFEAEYAEALGTTPVYVAKKGTDIEFDVKDYPLIFFQEYQGAKERIVKPLRRFEIWSSLTASTCTPPTSVLPVLPDRGVDHVEGELDVVAGYVGVGCHATVASAAGAQ